MESLDSEILSSSTNRDVQLKRPGNKRLRPSQLSASANQRQDHDIRQRDRFVTTRVAQDSRNELIRMNLPQVIKHSSSKADPFGRSVNGRPSTVQTPPLVGSNYAMRQTASQIHDSTRDSAVRVRSSNRRTTVWEIGGSIVMSEERSGVVDDINRHTGRGAHVPFYTSRFLDCHRLSDEMTSYAARLLLALDIDPSNRVLAPPLVHFQPQGSTKGVINERSNLSSEGRKRYNQVKPVWKDSQWTDIGSIACMTRAWLQRDALR